MTRPGTRQEPDPGSAAIAVLSLLLLFAAAAYDALRPAMVIALVLVFGTIQWVERRRPASAGRFVAAACMLVAIGMAWTGVSLPPDARDGSTCASLLAPFAAYRAAGALLALAATALTVALLRSTAADIGLMRPSFRAVVIALGALVAVGVGAAIIGPPVAEPFFGPLPIRLMNPSAIIPALLFAIANATMEETLYRGALLRWLLRWRGPAIAIGLQAALFGLAHGVGTDFAGSPMPVILATAAAAVGFAVLSLRTGSLLLPIALHAALDIPIYYANACVQRGG